MDAIQCPQVQDFVPLPDIDPGHVSRREFANVAAYYSRVTSLFMNRVDFERNHDIANEFGEVFRFYKRAELAFVFEEMHDNLAPLFAPFIEQIQQQQERHHQQIQQQQERHHQQIQQIQQQQERHHRQIQLQLQDLQNQVQQVENAARANQGAVEALTQAIQVEFQDVRVVIQQTRADILANNRQVLNAALNAVA